MPIQRAPRYSLLLDQLAKYTPEDHFDYSPTLSSVDAVKRATTTMNERYYLLYISYNFYYLLNYILVLLFNMRLY